MKSPYGSPPEFVVPVTDEEFAAARATILKFIATDLLEEHLQCCKELETSPNIHGYKDEVYEETVNRCRSLVMDAFDFSEDEVVTACDQAIQDSVFHGLLVTHQT